jgi:molybdenum ABC transporter ATP-binding protein
VDRTGQIDLRHRLSRVRLDVQLDLRRETLAMVGPSGAGKTSILRAVAGLLRPDEGWVRVAGRTWFDALRRVNLPPERRSVGLVFQDLALFPHLTVRRNVEYGLRGRVRGDQRGEVVAATLERFGVAHLARARPAEISGGERQRVALARAVAWDPDLLLLDEPLSALDPATKGAVAAELSHHLAELEIPAVLVSHDFADVVGLAGRIAVIEDGRIVQVGAAAELLQAPASPFVAALTGVNYFAGTAVRHGDLTEVRAAGGSGAVFLSTDPASGPVGVVVYPWDVALSAAPVGGSPRNALAGPVGRMAGVGNRLRVTVQSDPVIVAEVTDQARAALGLARGVPVVATWKATGTRLVPAGGGA